MKQSPNLEQVNAVQTSRNSTKVKSEKSGDRKSRGSRDGGDDHDHDDDDDDDDDDDNYGKDEEPRKEEPNRKKKSPSGNKGGGGGGGPGKPDGDASESDDSSGDDGARRGTKGKREKIRLLKDKQLSAPEPYDAGASTGLYKRWRERFRALISAQGDGIPWDGLLDYIENQ